MDIEPEEIDLLRTLILKSQGESLIESETTQLNELIRLEGGAHEAAVLIDQLSAFTDSDPFAHLRPSPTVNHTPSVIAAIAVSLRVFS